ncbi:MAG: hypothetical protein Q7J98_03775 [Kiritimatiellia bacterium]|nr:hypothetical protein [Kiritimatiellia bacterium]
MKQNYELAKMAGATLSAAERRDLIREWTGAPAPVEPDKIVAPKNIALRTDKTVRTVQNLFASGALTRVFLPGRKRSCGCRESELAALIGGAL